MPLVGALVALAPASCRRGGGDDAADDGGTESGTAGDDGDGPPADLDAVGPMGMRRLTAHEYDNTLLELLGDDTRPGSALLPEDLRTPFDNNYEIQTASRVLIEGAETLASEAAARLMADAPRRDTVIGCSPATPADEDCMRSFVSSFGRRALRRTLSDEELDDYVALGRDFATQATDFYVGADVVLRALLQDPEFLYRVERGTEVEGLPGVFRLSGFEVATRLSYVLWATTPDDAVLDAAEAGDLDDGEGRAAMAQQMLSDARSRGQVARFHAMWLGYEQLPHAATLSSALYEESAALIERVVFDDQDPWYALFLSTETFIDDALAQHYGVAGPGGSGADWVDVTGERQGILSHGSFLSAAANVGDTSPTKRGKLIRNRLMCEVVPDPPPDAPADSPPAAELGNCKWDRYAAHREQAGCKNCHDQMDPIGFGLENYDREGRFREHDDGAPECTIAGQGEVVGLGVFSGPAELSNLLVYGGRVQDCAVQQLYTFTSGHEPSAEDWPIIKDLTDEFWTYDYAFDRLIIDFVSHPSFGYRIEG